MTEYEQVREKALLTDGELLDLIIQWRSKANETNPRDLDVADLAMATRQAQLDKTLKTDGIEIRADDQSLPNTPTYVTYSAAEKAQQDMLEADLEGRHFVKVISKTARNEESNK